MGQGSKGGKSPVEEAGGGCAFLTAKGKAQRQAWLSQVWAPAETPQQKQKQEKMRFFAAKAAAEGGMSPSTAAATRSEADLAVQLQGDGE